MGHVARMNGLETYTNIEMNKCYFNGSNHLRGQCIDLRNIDNNHTNLFQISTTCNINKIYGRYEVAVLGGEYGLLRRVVSLKFTNASDVLDASIIKTVAPLERR